MIKIVSFAKIHSAGNDYMYVDTTRCPVENPEGLSKKWSTPHTGIGSNGLILIGRSDKADLGMRIFKADDSEAKTCGNSSRCIDKYLYDYKQADETEILFDALSGIKVLKLHVTSGEVDAGLWLEKLLKYLMEKLDLMIDTKYNKRYGIG